MAADALVTDWLPTGLETSTRWRIPYAAALTALNYAAAVVTASALVPSSGVRAPGKCCCPRGPL